MDLSQIITPYDSLKLDDKQQYQFYFDLTRHSLNCIQGNAHRLQCREISLQEIGYIKTTVDRLLYTLNALELRYLHIDEDTMEIDVTESGYPNSSALRFLANEISFVQQESNMVIESVNSLVDGFVEKLLKKKERISKEEVANAAFNIFHSTIRKDKLHRNFLFGGVHRSDIPTYKHVVYWINYDVLKNRPFLSIMYINPVEGKTISSSDKEQIEEVVSKTEAVSPIKSVIYEIDKNLKNVAPMLYKRLDLGPIISIFSRDDKALSESLRMGIKNKHLDIDSFAVELTLEQVTSKGILETGNRFSFVKKEALQNWTDPENYVFLMAPHNVIQYFYVNNEALIKELNKAPIDVPANHKKQQVE